MDSIKDSLGSSLAFQNGHDLPRQIKSSASPPQVVDFSPWDSFDCYWKSMAAVGHLSLGSLGR